MIGTIIFLEPKGTILEIIRAANARGYRVVAFTSDKTLLETAPEPYRTAVACIDKNISISGWGNETEILDLAGSVNSENAVVGVYSGLDPCAVISAKLRSQFALPTTQPDVLSLVLNKYKLRQRLQGLGLSKIKSFTSSEAEGWKKWELNGPAYFKPIHGFFSAYVKRCENLDDLHKAQSAWAKGIDSESPLIRDFLKSNADYHLEEAFDGELLSVEGFSTQGRFQSLGLLSRILFSKDPVVEMGSCFPYPHNLEDKIARVVKEAHEKLGITDGPTHTEVIVNKNGEIEIIDLNPRFVGADVLQSINHAYQTKFEETLLDFAIGKKVSIERPASTRFSCLQYVLPPKIDEFRSVSFSTDPDVKFHTSFLKPGTRISSTDRQIDYLGCYLTVMPTFSAAIEKSRALRTSVRVNGEFEGAF